VDVLNVMGIKSWIVTLTPLAIALGQTLKSIFTGEPLNEQEIELIKYLITAFIASGAIGQAKAITATLKK